MSENGKSLTIEEFVVRFRLSLADFGVWMIGNEPNTQRPQHWAASSLKVLIVRLSPYRFVTASMSHGLLGQLSRDVPGIFVDYGFFPTPVEAELFKREGIPPLWGTTAKRSWTEFDVLACSNSIAQELINLAWLFQQCGIPVDASARWADPALPLFILGGANAQAAGLAADAQSRSSLADLVYLGEAEQEWPSILAALRDAKIAGQDKHEVIRQIANNLTCVRIPGVVGSKPVERASSGTLAGLPSLIRNPVWYDAETVGLGNVAIDAGCPFLCAFCKEAWESKPYRSRPAGEILDHVRAAKRWQGLHAVNLFSFNLTSHPQAGQLLDGAREVVPTVLMKSQRFDLMTRRPELLRRQQSLGKTNFTLGLEGISVRLRDFLGKPISAITALKALEMILDGPVRQIKIFLMVTGHETDEDWNEFASVLDELHGLTRRSRTGGRAPVVLSSTPLIAMPNTPLQFHGFPERGKVNEFRDRLVSLARPRGMTCRESISYEEGRAAQLLLMSGSPQLNAVFSAVEKGTYQRYLPPAVARALEQTAGNAWVRWALSEKDDKQRFPWEEHPGSPASKLLYAKYLALQNQLAGGFRSIDEQPARSTFRPGNIPPATAVTDIWFNVWVAPDLAGVPPRFIQTALARELCVSLPELAAAYWRPGKIYLAQEQVPVAGIILCALTFKEDVLPILARISAGLLSGYGWRLVAYRSAPEPAPDGYLMEVPARPDEMASGERTFAHFLRDRSIKHTARNFGRQKVFFINPSYAKKTGCLRAIWDKERCRIILAAYKETGLAPVFANIGRSRWAVPITMAPVVTMWWSTASTGVCPTCKQPLWKDIWTGRPAAEASCPQICPRMDE